jgi:hypothetical protein
MVSSNERLYFSNSGNTFSVEVSVSRTDSIALAGTVVHSECLYTEPDELRWYSIHDSSKISYNAVPLICGILQPSDFQTKCLLIIYFLKKILTCITNFIFLISHWNFLQPPFNVSNLRPNIFLSSIWLISRLQFRWYLRSKITLKNILVNK